MIHIILRSILAALSVLIACSCVASDAQLVVPTGSEKRSNVANIDRALIELHNQFIAYIDTDQDADQFIAANPQLRVVDGHVLIDAVASESTVELESDLRSLGATSLSSHGQIVSCFFPIAGTKQLAELDSLKFARPAYSTTRPK